MQPRNFSTFTIDDIHRAATGAYFIAPMITNYNYPVDQTFERTYDYTGVSEQAHAFLDEIASDNFLRRIYLGEV